MSYNRVIQNTKGKGGNEPWRNRERHYCAVCNVWMGSDRQSILLHENGKKHKDNAQQAQQQQRQERTQQEKQAQQLQASLKAMEAAAQQSYAQDRSHFAHSVPVAPPHMAYTQPHAGASMADPTAPTSLSNDNNDNSNKRQLKQEKKEWESRKKHRQEEKKKAKDDEEEVENDGLAGKKKPKIGDNEGFYTVGNVSGQLPAPTSSSEQTSTTYLEGVVFGDLLEEDMPIQIWTGSSSAGSQEQQLVQYQHLWINGLVAAVRKKYNSQSHADRKVVDVAYLSKPDDTEETLETSVPLKRIRIVLGTDDEKIPATLEEARIMAMGGVQEKVVHKSDEAVDEATGFTGWSTVAVKRTTVRQELREERERLRQARQEAAEKAEQGKKQAAARRMEEAKVSNADDSALGAFDVWSRGGKEGYKGVDIHAEVKVEAHELGKKLATEGTNVAFKKASGAAFKKKNKKKQNRRTTSADDD